MEMTEVALGPRWRPVRGEEQRPLTSQTEELWDTERLHPGLFDLLVLLRSFTTLYKDMTRGRSLEDLWTRPPPSPPVEEADSVLCALDPKLEDTDPAAHRASSLPVVPEAPGSADLLCIPLVVVVCCCFFKTVLLHGTVF